MSVYGRVGKSFHSREQAPAIRLSQRAKAVTVRTPVRDVFGTVVTPRKRWREESLMGIVDLGLSIFVDVSFSDEEK